MYEKRGSQLQSTPVFTWTSSMEQTESAPALDDFDNSNSVNANPAENNSSDFCNNEVVLDLDVVENFDPPQSQICECGDDDEDGEREDSPHLTSPPPTFKDMATWTVEDDMPSPLEAFSPADSPVLGHMPRHHDCYQFDERDEYPENPSHFQPNPGQIPHSTSSCFTVSSQLQSREARLYENVPTSASHGMMCFPGHSSDVLMHSSSNFLEDLNVAPNLPTQHRYGTRQSTNPATHTPHGGSEVNFLNVNEYLGGGPPSRSSWVDSGRESLSFDGESGNTANNSNSNGSSKNLLLIPAPGTGRGEPTATSCSGSGGYSPSNSYRLSSSSKAARKGGKNMSRKERLVRQKHAIDENFQPYSMSGSAGISAAAGYLAVPSPRRMGGSIDPHIHGHHHLGVTSVASPISLHRHPNSQQLMLQENKKSRGLISGCESPYGTSGGMSCMSDYTRGVSGHRMRCDSGRSPSRGMITGMAGPRRGLGVGGQSFDYGELPSHQMFPNLKRHLLSGRQFSHPYGDGCNGGSGNGNNSNSHIPPHLQAQHRSFPAGLLSGVAPRSCSMGDLTSGASPASLKGKTLPENQVPVSSATNPPGGMSSTIPLVGSLPLPPATSVTYEFSLAPVSGTLAPGWHLTAVQRGLATAVPLAAVVARRRIPRPRSSRPRFGFTDKSEARRAKWTIAVTALALLAMSMLLVGVTLRLAPLIDDLVRKENEDLLRGVIHTPSTLNNISLSSSTPASLDNYQQENIVLSRSINGGGGSEANLILPPSSRSDLTIPKNSTISSYASPLSQHLLGSRK